YRQTGRSVTGLEYKAWPNGPAPASLWHEMHDGPKPDLARAVTINQVRDELTGAPKRRDITARRAFDKKHFTKRELQIMETLAFIYRDARGDDMRDVSHARDLPWGRVYAGGAGNGKVIPYGLALDSPPVQVDRPGLDKEEVERRDALFKEIERATI